MSIKNEFDLKSLTLCIIVAKISYIMHQNSVELRTWRNCLSPHPSYPGSLNEDYIISRNVDIYESFILGSNNIVPFFFFFKFLFIRSEVIQNIVVNSRQN